MPLHIAALILVVLAVACILFGGFAGVSLGSLLAGIAAALGMPHPHRRRRHDRR